LATPTLADSGAHHRQGENGEQHRGGIRPNSVAVTRLFSRNPTAIPYFCVWYQDGVIMGKKGVAPKGLLFAAHP
jgi:hypothetical protein